MGAKTVIRHGSISSSVVPCWVLGFLCVSCVVHPRGGAQHALGRGSPPTAIPALPGSRPGEGRRLAGGSLGAAGHAARQPELAVYLGPSTGVTVTGGTSPLVISACSGGRRAKGGISGRKVPAAHTCQAGQAPLRGSAVAGQAGARTCTGAATTGVSSLTGDQSKARGSMGPVSLRDCRGQQGSGGASGRLEGAPPGRAALEAACP